MKTKTLAAVLLLVALAAYVLLFEKDKSSAGSLAALTGIEPSKVTAVQWKAKDGLVRLVRSGETWHVESPVAGNAEKTAATAAIDDLLTRAPDRVLDSAGAKPSEYGLDPPQLQVDYDLSGGQHVSLLFGSPNPGGADRYARASTSPQIFLIPAFSITSLQSRDAESVLDHKVTDFDPDQAQSVTLTQPSGTTRILRQGDNWQMTSPWKVQADRDAVIGSLGVVRNLNTVLIASFVRSPQALGQYGLDPPRARLKVNLKDGKKVGADLGAAVRNGFYAKRLDDSSVFVLKKGDAAALNPQPLSLVNRALVSLSPGDVRSFHLHNSRGDIQAHKESRGWVLDNPSKGKPLNASVMTEVASAIKQKDLTAVSAELKDWPRFGLDHPVVTLSVTGSDGKSIQVVFGPPAPKGSAAGAAIGSPVILAVPSTVVQVLSQLHVQ